jgi:hypothetical protein
MLSTNADNIFFRCMIPTTYWRTTPNACQMAAMPDSGARSRNNLQKSGVRPAIPSFKIKTMNFSRTSLYAAAFVMGCLALNNSATAQVRVVGETPGGSGSSSSTSVTRPPYYSSVSPGGSGSSVTRPPYYSSVSPGSSGGSGGGEVTRPNYLTPSVPSTGQQDPILQIGVYPNPATELLYVEISGLRPDESVHVNLYSERGTRFYVPMERAGESIRIQVGNLPRGTYRIQIITNSSEVIKNIELI